MVHNFVNSININYSQRDSSPAVVMEDNSRHFEIRLR